MKTKQKSNVGRNYIPVVGKRLFRLALHWADGARPGTKRARDAAVKAMRGRKRTIRGSRRADRAREVVDEVVEAIHGARRARNARRSPSRGRRSGARPAPGATEAVTNRVMCETPLAERLRQRTQRRLEAVNPMRRGAAGGHSLQVHVVSDPTEVGYTVVMDENRDTYAGRFKGWIANEDHHVIRVPGRWLRMVHGAGLAVVDGLLTLDVSPLERAPEGVELYRAVWAGQGRGYQVRTDHGYIALTRDPLGGPEYACHGRTARGALQGLKRKVDRIESVRLAPNVSLSRLLRDADAQGIEVRLSDARAVGACHYGIRAWCYAVGLDPDAGRAPLRAVWEGYSKNPAPEARAAMIYAIRRYRMRPVREATAMRPANVSPLRMGVRPLRRVSVYPSRPMPSGRRLR
ncbi:hypothetical protein QWY84_19230 [Aquisalimonas lutea]|uniref:hypothetical protein n=1 Tax=Aquisalimonas lutea TaxID=1327750 RepID=UPI0025B4C5E8|nr:hypothetical protein [Aquisalimonas lutea]MDN3519745.1 hypothetical protein [Aquisalimonas lutea]